VLVIATGAAAGLGAVLLVSLLRWTQSTVWPAGEALLEQVVAARPLRRFLVPTLGGVLVTAVALVVRQPLGGHGTAGIIESIWIRAGRLPLWRSLVRGAVSIIAVGMGAPLGREGALIQAGAATGSWLGDRLRIPADQTRVLVACGAAGGIAAAYNVPIGAALFGLEVLLGSFALELFGPIVISCVTATLISRTLLSSHPTYIIPPYALTRPREVLLGLLFAPLYGAASALYVRAIDAFADWFDRVPRRERLLLPPLALAVVGVLALRFPQLLGNGYDTVNDSLLGHLPLTLLVALPLLKMLATGLCAGAGVPGGLFTPSLFYGALLGGALGHLAHSLWPGGAPPSAYALIGMGAVLAGTTHAAVSSVLIIFELTGDYDVILPLMLTCVVSAAISRHLEPESLYTSVLRRRHVRLPEVPRPEWLRATRVRSLVRPHFDHLPATADFDKVILTLLALPRGHDLYVTASDGSYLGTIVLEALKGHIPDRSLAALVVAADVMDARVAPLSADAPLSEAAARLAESPLDKLPVVDAQRRLIGCLSKTDLLRLRRF
jgi:CIC family chloride channel protein